MGTDLITTQFSLGPKRAIFCFQYVVSLRKLSVTNVWTPMASVFKLGYIPRDSAGTICFRKIHFQIFWLSPKTFFLASRLPFNNSPSLLYKWEKPNLSKILQSFISLGVKFQHSQLLEWMQPSLMNNQFSSFQSLRHVQLFVTPWTAACQASLSITNSWSLLKLMAIE